MRLIHPLAATALLTVPGVALAQMAGAAPGSGPSAAMPTASATATPVTAGLPVKDKNGKPIGKVTSVKSGPSGKTIATIQMGADSMGVDASALAVDNGSATINFSKSELDSYLKGR